MSKHAEHTAMMAHDHRCPDCIRERPNFEAERLAFMAGRAKRSVALDELARTSARLEEAKALLWRFVEYSESWDDNQQVNLDILADKAKAFLARSEKTKPSPCIEDLGRGPGPMNPRCAATGQDRSGGRRLDWLGEGEAYCACPACDQIATTSRRNCAWCRDCSWECKPYVDEVVEVSAEDLKRIADRVFLGPALPKGMLAVSRGKPESHE